jgi:hypothetical protein
MGGCVVNAMMLLSRVPIRLKNTVLVPNRFWQSHVRLYVVFSLIFERAQFFPPPDPPPRRPTGYCGEQHTHNSEVTTHEPLRKHGTPRTNEERDPQKKKVKKTST